MVTHTRMIYRMGTDESDTDGTGNPAIRELLRYENDSERIGKVWTRQISRIMFLLLEKRLGCYGPLRIPTDFYGMIRNTIL